MQIVIAGDGKPYMQKKKRRRRRYKLSAKRRAQLRTAARRVKVPVLTGAAVGIPVIDALNYSKGRRGMARLNYFLARLFESFTGVYIDPRGTGATFRYQGAARGLVPLVVVTVLKRFRLFSGLNRILSRYRLPVTMG